MAFRSATEPFDTSSPAAWMMVQILGVFAEFERATIIDRVIAGMERKAAQGHWPGSREPIGYRAVKGKGGLVMDEGAAPLVELMFDLCAHAVAHRRNAARCGREVGKPWSYKAVLTMLRRRTYPGLVHFRNTWARRRTLRPRRSLCPLKPS